MNSKPLILIVLLLFSLQYITRAQSTNSALELGDFTNWKGWTGTNTTGTIDINGELPGFVSGRQDIVSAGYDSISGFRMVNEGHFALRLGSMASSLWKDQVTSYTVHVTAANAHLSFSYSLVLSDPLGEHALWQKPFFSYWVSTTDVINNSQNVSGTSGRLIGSVKTVYSDITNPFFQTVTISGAGGGSYSVKDWTDECIDLTSYIGQDVTVYFATSGCSLGGHFGYAYIDGLGTPNGNTTPVFTVPQTICNYELFIADGSASTGEKDHYWKLEKLNSSDPADVIAGTDNYMFNTNQPVSSVDLYKMYTDAGGTVTNGWYKITLGVQTCVGGWKTISQVVKVDLPLFSTNDVYRCCGDNSPVTLTAQSTDALLAYSTSGPFSGILSYYDNAGTFLGNATNYWTPVTVWGATYFRESNAFVVTDYNNAVYTVVFTRTDGCKNKNMVRVINKPSDLYPYIKSDFCAGTCTPPTTLTALELTPILGLDYPCSGAYISHSSPIYKYATEPALLTYSWNTGETSPSITIHPGITNYTCTISNGCASKTATIDISPYVSFSTAPLLPSSGSSAPPIPLNTIWWSNNVVPGDPSRKWVVYHIGGPATGVAPAYNAVKYRLVIDTRYGESYTMDGTADCNGFKNGAISWDGTTPSGRDLEMGTYYFHLTLTNCNGDEALYEGDISLFH